MKRIFKLALLISFFCTNSVAQNNNNCSADYYNNKAFNEDPLFTETKVVFSMYNDEFPTTFSKDFAEKSLIEGVNSDDVKILENADYLAINKLAIDWSDAVIMGSPSINEDLLAYAKASGKTFMDYKNGDEYVQAYSDLYDSLVSE